MVLKRVKGSKKLKPMGLLFLKIYRKTYKLIAAYKAALGTAKCSVPLEGLHIARCLACQSFRQTLLMLRISVGDNFQLLPHQTLAQYL